MQEGKTRVRGQIKHKYLENNLFIMVQREDLHWLHRFILKIFQIDSDKAKNNNSWIKLKIIILKIRDDGSL